MQSHEQNVILIRIYCINICDQCDLLQESGKCCFSALCLHCFLIGNSLGDQLVDVLNPCSGFLCILCFEFIHVSGEIDHFFQDLCNAVCLCLALE